MEQQRYRAFHTEMKKLFGSRIDRITINAGMTCPNIDGTKAKGGCTFCQDASFTGLTFYQNPKPLSEQIEEGKSYLQTRYPSKKFFAYFQNGTNTYAPVAHLRQVYEEALSFPEIVGLFISTRPDCFTKAHFDLLEELNQKTYLWVELGIPSHREEINRRLNRAHTLDDFEKSTTELARRGVRVCAHVMLGLPGESPDEMKEKADYFNRFPLSGIKIHNLVVFKDTVLEKQFLNGDYQPITLEDYVKRCVDFLECLNPELMVQRLNAHGPRRLTVAPDWSVNKLATLNAVHAELEGRDTWQGKKWSPEFS